MISHYNNYLKNKKNDNIDNNYIKYLKYKTKYQLLKEKIYNQNGGDTLGFYIYVKNGKNFLGYDELIYKKIELHDPLINKELSLIKYDNKTIYDDTNKIHMIKEKYFFNAPSYIGFNVNIYENTNDLFLIFDINTTEKFTIKFNYSSDFNFTIFKGKLKLNSITLPNSLKTQIKIELNDNTLDIKGVGFGFNIDFNVLTFNSFIQSCYNLFIKFDDIPNNFMQLRLDIQKLFSSTSCNNDKMFGEFVINHYLHNLYSKIGPAVGKNISTFYYLMTKSGYKLLVKILTDLINNDFNETDTTSKKIDSFCNNKNSYYHNVMKYFRTNLDLTEIKFKNGSGVWVELPNTIDHILSDGSKIQINPQIILDSGNSVKTVVGLPLINFLGLLPQSIVCTETCRGIGGSKLFENQININIQFPYYNNKEFTVECLIDKDINSSTFPIFLFGWINILQDMADQGYTIYGEK